MSLLLRLSVFLSFLLSAKFPVFITQVQEATRTFRQGRERLGYASQMAEKKLSSWSWIIAIHASVNDTVVLQCSLFEYGR